MPMSALKSSALWNSKTNQNHFLANLGTHVRATNKDGSVEGYGMGNTDFALKGAIQISPPVFWSAANGQVGSAPWLAHL
jgi:hypothetical protein